MIDPFDPLGIKGPNPANIQPPFPPLISDWGQLWQVGTAMFGGTQGQLPRFPNSFNVPYGSDLITASLADANRSALQGSRSYAYGLDEEAFGRTFTTLIGQAVAQFGADLSPQQIAAIRSAAKAVATFGEMGLGIAEQLMSQDGDAAAGMNVVKFLRENILDSFYGPSGARVPLYYAMSKLADNVPLGQRDVLLMQTMRQISPVGGKVTGGFTNRQAASMISAAASMGYNVFNNIDTDISRELAGQQLDDFTRNIDWFDLRDEQVEQIRNLSAIQTNETINDLVTEGNLTQAINNSLLSGVTSIEDQAGRLDARRQFSRFLDVTNRIKGIEGYKDKAPQTFGDLISMRSTFEDLVKNTKDKKQQAYYQGILNDIKVIERSVGEDQRRMNIQNVMQKAEQYQREQLTKVANKKGIYAEDAEKQAQFVEAMIQREKLSAYGIENLDSWAEGDNWKTLLKTANKEQAAVINAYYGEGGLHNTYLKAKQDLSDKDYERTIGLLRQYQKAETPEQKQALIEANPELQSYINDFDMQNQAQQVKERTDRLLKPGSIMRTALAMNGTPIEDNQQLAAFINKVTYGGLGNMDADSLATVVEQIGSGMIDSGASGNDLMQMAGRGAEAAASIGGDAQAGAINAMRAGLAARAVAKTMHMDPAKAQEIAAKAAGMSNKSLVEKTYSAISNFTEGKEIKGDNEEFNNIINKIQHNESLTREELNTLYRKSSDIMAYAGMSTDVQHSYLNANYSDNRAASDAGTTWMMFSTIAQDNMRDNMTKRMEDFGLDLKPEEMEQLAGVMLDTIQDIDNPQLLTSQKLSGKFREQLLKHAPEELKALIKDKNITDNQLQMIGNLATKDEGIRTEISQEQVIDQMKLAKYYQDSALVQGRMAVLRSITPDVVSSTFGNFMNALTGEGGSLEKALVTLSTAVTDKNLDPKEREALFYNMAVATLTDPKLAEQAGIKKEDAAIATSILAEVYKGTENDPETLANFHKILRGDLDEGDLTEEQFKKYQNVVNNLKPGDQEKLKNIIGTGVTNIRTKWNGSGETKLSGDKVSLPDSSEPPVSSTPGTPAPSGSTKPEEKQEGEPVKPGSASAAPTKSMNVRLDEDQFNELKQSMAGDRNPTVTP